MQRKLTKAPLVYVLAQIKISPILTISDYTSRLQEAIRKDFPLFNKVEVQVIEIKTQGNPELTRTIQWHFIDKTSNIGIIIDSNAITFHTTLYDSFENLIEKFREVLSKFNSIVNIPLYTGIGVRYVNFINNSPTEYLIPQLLGFHLPKNEKIKDKYFVKNETIQETKEGIIKIQTTNFSNKEFMGANNIKEILMPPDLLQGAMFLSMDSHKEKKPTENYAILDIDHFTSDEKNNSTFDVDEIIKNLKELHEIIYIAFKASITTKALNEWK